MTGMYTIDYEINFLVFTAFNGDETVCKGLHYDARSDTVSLLFDGGNSKFFTMTSKNQGDFEFALEIDFG